MVTSMFERMQEARILLILQNISKQKAYLQEILQIGEPEPTGFDPQVAPMPYPLRSSLSRYQ